MPRALGVLHPSALVIVPTVPHALRMRFHILTPAGDLRIFDGDTEAEAFVAALHALGHLRASVGNDGRVQLDDAERARVSFDAWKATAVTG